MSELKAVLWDVDGTLAETERDGHRVAFNLAFDACGLSWRWDEARYGELLRITGGKERLLHDMERRSDGPVLATERAHLANLLHAKKNAFYADIVAHAQIPLREGVGELLDECADRGVLLGIATTTSRINVDALLRVHLGDQWARSFAVLVCGEDVQRKKPDPEVYFQALRALGLGPLDVVAIEDSPGGASAARAADVPVVITRSAYFLNATIEGAIAIGPGLGTRSGWTPALHPTLEQEERVGLDDLVDWCAQMDTVSQFM